MPLENSSLEQKKIEFFNAHLERPTWCWNNLKFGGNVHQKVKLLIRQSQVAIDTHFRKLNSLPQTKLTKCLFQPISCIIITLTMEISEQRVKQYRPGNQTNKITIPEPWIQQEQHTCKIHNEHNWAGLKEWLTQDGWNSCGCKIGPSLKRINSVQLQHWIAIILVQEYMNCSEQIAYWNKWREQVEGKAITNLAYWRTCHIHK